MDFTVNVPINEVSFGHVSLNILREFYKMGLSPNIIPIGGVQLLNPVDQGFAGWLDMGIRKALRSHKRSLPTFKLWHINGSLESVSNKQLLYTFYETDSPTPEEINIVSNQSATFFSSKFSADLFTENGATNVQYCPIGFDSTSFSITDIRPFSEPRITFSVVGKFEHRKRHIKIIQTWIEKYGRNKEYFLQCAIHNPFFAQQEMEQIYCSLVRGHKDSIFNVKFYDFMPTPGYNEWLNAADIVIGMSGGEGHDIPVFTSLALGKHGVILNAHAYKDWANAENAVLVEPNSKIPAYDNKFFVQGSPWSQGNFFDWSPEDFIRGCEVAIAKVKTSKTNWDGMKLQNKFSYAKTAENILKKLGEL